MERIMLLVLRAIIDLFLKLLTLIRNYVDEKVNISDPTTPAEIKKISKKNIKKAVYAASTTELQPTVAVTKTISGSSILEEPSAWQGKLDHNMITNGVIFAEILQPPRAYRPFAKRLK